MCGGYNFDDRWKKIPGWLSQDQAECLAFCAGQAPKGNAVEVGSFKGKSASVIAQVRPLICVDDFTTGGEGPAGRGTGGDFLAEFLENTKGLPIRVIKGDHIQAGNEFKDKIALLFMDGSHKLAATSMVGAAWIPKLLDEGIVIFHDYDSGWAGVMQFVSDVVNTREFAIIAQAPSMIALKKTSDLTIGRYFGLEEIEQRQDGAQAGPQFKSLGTYQNTEGIFEVGLEKAGEIKIRKLEAERKLAICLSLASAYQYFLPQPFVFSFLDLFLGQTQTWKKFGIKSFMVFKDFGMPIDINRNRLVEQALEWGATDIMFVDVDQTFPADMVTGLLSGLDKFPKAGVMSGVYFKKCIPFLPVPGVFRNPADEHNIVPVDPLTAPEFYRADVIGLGCALFRAETFKKIPKPWFEYTVYPKDGQCGITEDVAYCRKLRLAGYDILVARDVVCGHIINQVVNEKSWRAQRPRLNNIAGDKPGEEK